jgi:hypothetical protein
LTVRYAFKVLARFAWAAMTTHIVPEGMVAGAVYRPEVLMVP